jgi:tRNA (adenine57-N1/adenine58-N1)-methyltransferase
MVGESGRVYSYERKEEVQKLAISNLEKLGLANRVEFKVGNAADGFAERDADALFLDLPNPYDYMPQVKASLKGGGYLGMILPTVNQVSKTLEALKMHHFAFVQVCEILMRYFKTDWDRLRPTDRMLAHTGYLLFARSVNELDPEILGESKETEA